MDAMLILSAEMVLDLLDRAVLCPVRRDGTLMKFCALRSAHPSCRAMAIIKTYCLFSVVKRGIMLIIVVIATFPGIEGGTSGWRITESDITDRFFLSLDYWLVLCLYFDGTNTCKSYRPLKFGCWWSTLHESNQLRRRRRATMSGLDQGCVYCINRVQYFFTRFNLHTSTSSYHHV